MQPLFFSLRNDKCSCSLPQVRSSLTRLFSLPSTQASTMALTHEHAQTLYQSGQVNTWDPRIQRWHHVHICLPFLSPHPLPHLLHLHRNASAVARLPAQARCTHASPSIPTHIPPPLQAGHSHRPCMKQARQHVHPSISLFSPYF